MKAGIKVITTKHRKYSDKKGFYYVNEKTSDVNTHMLRHSFATRGIEAGMTCAVLKDILGHSDIQTTINIYGEVFAYYQNSESEKAEKYLEEQMNKYEERFKLIEKNQEKKWSGNYHVCIKIICMIIYVMIRGAKNGQNYRQC